MPSLRLDYALDDALVITKNRFTQRGVAGLDSIFGAESFVGYFPTQKNLVTGQRYRPLSIATFALEESLFGRPEGQNEAEIVQNDRSAGLLQFRHGVNTVLYGLTILLLWALARLIWPPTEGGYWTQGSFVAVVLFAVHPLHTEVVANIKGRDELLAFLGLLGLVFYYVKHIKTPKTAYLIAIFLCFLGSLLSKEHGIIGWVWAPMTAFFILKPRFSAHIKPLSMLLLATLIFWGLRQHALGSFWPTAPATDLMNNPFGDMNFGEKSATIVYTLGEYLRLLVWPHPLTHDYYPYQVPKMTWQLLAPWAALLVYLGLIGYVLVKRHRPTPAVYGLGLYLTGLLLVSNIFFPIGSFMNERFIYVASWGACLFFAYFLLRIKEKWGKPAFLCLFIGCIGLGIGRTYTRLPDWANNDSLNRAAIIASPNSARAQLFYGVTLWDERYLTLKDSQDVAARRRALDSITPYFERSLAILPNYTAAQRMFLAAQMGYDALTPDSARVWNALLPLVKRPTVDAYTLESLRRLGTDPRRSASERDNFLKHLLDMVEKTQPNGRWAQEIKRLIEEISPQK